MNHHGQQQSHGVHHDVPLASGYPFASVVTPRPPFSVVFTDWLSMIAALGVASRPATSRTRTRKASSTRSQVPSSRHFRKYHQTSFGSRSGLAFPGTRGGALLFQGLVFVVSLDLGPIGCCTSCRLGRTFAKGRLVRCLPPIQFWVPVTMMRLCIRSRLGLLLLPLEARFPA